MFSIVGHSDLIITPTNLCYMSLQNTQLNAKSVSLEFLISSLSPRFITNTTGFVGVAAAAVAVALTTTTYYLSTLF